MVSRQFLILSESLKSFSVNILWKSRNSCCLIPGRYRPDFKQELHHSELFSRNPGKHFPIRYAWEELHVTCFFATYQAKNPTCSKSHPIPCHRRCVQDHFHLQMTLQTWTSSIIQAAHSGIERHPDSVTWGSGGNQLHGPQCDPRCVSTAVEAS